MHFFIPMEKAEKLIHQWHKNFPRISQHDWASKILNVEELPSAWGGYSPLPSDRYVLIFRKKS